jgi:manganese oxidase
MQQMGMYGPLVVKALNGVNRAWTGGPSYDKEYVWTLSEYDSVWHNSPEASVNYSYYNPDYYLINGKASPASGTDSNTVISARKGQKVLLRLINAGYLIDEVNLGGLPFTVIASDGRPLSTSLTNVTKQKIAPGERYDLLLSLNSTGSWTADVKYLNWYGQAVRGTASTKIQVS